MPIIIIIIVNNAWIINNDYDNYKHKMLVLWK